MQHLSRSHGLPLAIYADRHTIFQTPKNASIAEELAGKSPRSQFARLLDELAIQLIPAFSPQAKGRIERLFGTLQDWLVKALRQAGTTSLDDANLALQRFLPNYNSHFTVPPAQAGSAFRPWPADLQPSDVLCFKHERIVAKDNTISFNGLRLPIAPGPAHSSYAHCRVGSANLGRRLTAEDIRECLTELFCVWGVPEHIRSDNAPEFKSRRICTWPTELGTETLLIELGSPVKGGTSRASTASYRM